ncbi:MAG: molybdenum cofactor guanylyltransferase [Flavobacteriales bacterium]
MMDRGWTGVVLAGGRSSRMGSDKALLEFEGSTLLHRAIQLLRQHCREVLVIGHPERHADPHATVVPDERPGLGPLGGLATALKVARYGRLLVVACDMPMVNDRLLVRLKGLLDQGADAAVPRHEGGLEPLAAAYHRHCMEPFDHCLSTGLLRMTDGLAAVRTAHLDLVPGSDGWPADLFRNLNTPTDL